MTGLPLDPVADPAAAEARAVARALHEESVPMVLALEDVSSGTPRPLALPGLQELGARYADLLQGYRRALRPDAGDEDHWAVHDVLVVLAQEHGPVRP